MKLNTLDLNKFYVFSSVVRCQGYTGAAEELGLTKSAISQSITSLESSLGRKLFHRIRGRLQVTDAGKSFFEEIQRSQLLMQGAVDRLTLPTAKKNHRLRVGAYLEFAKSQLMPAVEDYLLLYPDATIQFVFDSPSRLEKLLDSDKIDLSISIFPHKKSKSVRSERLYHEELVLVSHPDVIGDRPSANQLQQISFVEYFPSQQLLKKWWHTHFRKPYSNLNVRCYAHTADMVLELIKRRLGAGIIPKYFFDLQGRGHGLNIVRPTSKALTDFLWLNLKSNKMDNHGAQSFLKVLRNHFN